MDVKKVRTSESKKYASKGRFIDECGVREEKIGPHPGLSCGRVIGAPSSRIKRHSCAVLRLRSRAGFLQVNRSIDAASRSDRSEKRIE